MFAKQHRLSKTSDVQKTLARGRSFFNPFFSVKFRSSASAVRITVVVSTKVSKKAVRRNQIKRVVRQQLRVRLNNLQKGDYVIMAKPSCAKLSNEEVKNNIIRLLTSSRLLT